MDELEKRRRDREMSTRYVAGERLHGIEFRHNSHVSFTDGKGGGVEGYEVVGAARRSPLRIYKDFMVAFKTALGAHVGSTHRFAAVQLRSSTIVG